MPNHTKRHLHYKNMGYDDEISRHARKIGRPFAAAIRAGVAPMTAFDKIARTTEFVLGCYAAADWHISPAPWNQVGTLPDVLHRTMEGRCLPNELMPRPTWA